MTALDGRQAARRSDPGPAGPDGAARGAPVIVLAYPHSGGGLLASLLSASGDLACTSGTGLLPLCDQAAAVWRRAEGGDDRAGKISALASASVRALVAAVATHILASAGRDRWCEVAAVSPGPAETFLALYPAARFICLHRCFGDVARAAVQASPWGLAGPAYSPFIAAYPGSTVAALAACWAAHTAALLAFERNHPRECLRIRFEDLAAAQHETARKTASFLGIGGIGSRARLTAEHESETTPDSASPVPGAHLPVDQIPPALLTQVNDLLRQLGYPGLLGRG
jgi:hypothetical protein